MTVACFIVLITLVQILFYAIWPFTTSSSWQKSLVINKILLPKYSVAQTISFLQENQNPDQSSNVQNNSKNSSNSWKNDEDEVLKLLGITDEVENDSLQSDSDTLQSPVDSEQQFWITNNLSVTQEPESRLNITSRDTHTDTDSNITFDFDKANIRPDQYPTLNQIARILELYPDQEISLSSHTDNSELPFYQMVLAKRRIDSVINYLTQKAGVDIERFLYATPYGALKPIASNETQKGRAQNRRIEFDMYTAGIIPPKPVATIIEDIVQLDSSRFSISFNGEIKPAAVQITPQYFPNRILLEFEQCYYLGPIYLFNFNFHLVPSAKVTHFHSKNFRKTRIAFKLSKPQNFNIDYEESQMILSIQSEEF